MKKTCRSIVWIPGEPLRVQEIEDSLEAIVKITGGYTTTIPASLLPLPLNCLAMVFEGPHAGSLRLKPNFRLKRSGELIVGGLLIQAHNDEGETRDLTDSEIAMIMVAIDSGLTRQGVA